MNKIEEESGSTLFDTGGELDDGDNNNINMSDDEGHDVTYTIEEMDDGEHNMADDEDHCITYTIEELDDGEHIMGMNNEDGHCITVTNENETVRSRLFFCFNFIFISSQLDGEEVYYELIRNQKGREKLYADGFGFHRNGKREGTTRWICEFYTTKQCSASATTIETVHGDIKVRRADVDNHNHHPDPLR